MEASKRLFIGISLPSEILKRVHKQVLAFQKDPLFRRLGVRWMDSVNLHLTLKFLGETSTDQIPSLVLKIKEECARFEKIQFSLKGIGCFPSWSRASVFWIGIDEPAGALTRLASGLDERLESIGFKKESRGYHPHITLARFTGSQDLSRLNRSVADQDFGEVTAIQLSLFESELIDGSRKYSELAVLPLISAN